MSGIRDLNVKVIRQAWTKRTSACPGEWSRKNRARGQCAATALVVQDVCGGTLIRTVATLPDGFAESHYATMIEHGVMIDLTEEQFPEGTTFGPWEERTREYVLSFPETRDRYMMLAQRLNEVRTLEKIDHCGESLP